MIDYKKFFSAVRRYFVRNDMVMPSTELLSLQLLEEPELTPLESQLQATIEQVSPFMLEMERLDMINILKNNMSAYEAYRLGATQMRRLLGEIGTEGESRIELLTK